MTRSNIDRCVALVTATGVAGSLYAPYTILFSLAELIPVYGIKFLPRERLLPVSRKRTLAVIIRSAGASRSRVQAGCVKYITERLDAANPFYADLRALTRALVGARARVTRARSRSRPRASARTYVHSEIGAAAVPTRRSHSRINDELFSLILAFRDSGQSPSDF